MASKQPSEEPEEAADVRNVRLYSDFLLFFVKAGRLQHHPLLDGNRQRGVLSLLGSERVTKLTPDRRMRPVLMTITPGTPPQRVYLVAIVREAVTLDELTDIVTRFNASLEGLSTAEKEQEIKTLIRRTGSRVLPGLNFLPGDYYKDDEDYEGRSVPRRSRRRDRDGKTILDSDDEYIVAKEGKPNPDSRQRSFVKLPRKTAKVPEPKTDSETSSNSSGSSMFAKPAAKTKRSDDQAPAKQSPRKRPKIVEEDEFESEEFPPTQPPDVSDDEEVPDIEPDTQQQPPERTSSTVTFKPSDWGLSTERHDSTAGQQVEQTQSTDSNVLDEILHKMEGVEQNQDTLKTRMDKLVEDMTATRDFIHDFVNFRQGKIGVDEMRLSVAKRDARAQSQALSVISGSSHEPDPSYNEYETRLKKLFPINVYSRTMNWLLQQKPVQTFLQYEIMRRAYSGYPTTKPDLEHVMSKYFDYMLSNRLQSHLGKAVEGTSPLFHFGRFPLPKVILDIAKKELKGLSKQPAPGMKTEIDYFKDWTTTAKRNFLNNNQWVLDADSLEQMAQRLMWERMDFFTKHKHQFPNEDPHEPSWTFAKELKATKELTGAKGKPRNKDFKYEAEDPPENIEALMFKDMKKGDELHRMSEAKAIVQGLIESPPTRPTFSEVTWELINEVVAPSHEEIAMGRKRAAEKELTHKNRLKRRRDAYHKKHGKEPDKDDLDMSLEQTFSDEDAHDADTSGPQTTPKTSPVIVVPQVQEDTIVIDLNAPKEQIVQQLFGDLTSSSASGSQGEQGAQVKEVTVPVVQKSPETGQVLANYKDKDQQTKDAQGPDAGVSIHAGGVMASASALAMAKASGIIEEGMSAEVRTSGTVTEAVDYSVTGNLSTAGGTDSINVTGTSTTSKTVNEVLTVPESLSGVDIFDQTQPEEPKAPRAKSVFRQYEDLEIEPLKYSDTSTSSSGKTQNDPSTSKGVQAKKTKSIETKKSPQKKLSLVEQISSEIDRSHGGEDVRRSNRGKETSKDKRNPPAKKSSRGKKK